MRIFLDTIDEEPLERLWPQGAFWGVTTNPLILARAKVDAAEAVRRCRSFGIGRLFLQAALGTAADVAADAQRLRKLFDGELWVKIPAVPDGFGAMRALKGSGVRTAATAIHSLGQAVLAGEAGADVLIPFLGRAQKAGRDPARLAVDVCRVAADAGAQVLAASVKTEEHVRVALHAGCWAATIPPELAETLGRDEVAAGVVAQFRAASQGGEE